MDLTACLFLVGIGILLMPAEFVLPTGGVLCALGLAAIIVGIVFAFGLGTSTGLLVLFGVVLLLPVLMLLIGKLGSRSPLVRRFLLTAPENSETLAGSPNPHPLEDLRGRIGRTLSALRPAGAVDFDGRRVDSLSEGNLVEPGQYVRCIDVRAGKVIVREIDKPDLDSPEPTKFPEFDFR
jgi:membrane-bound serine protease (ClpP class)